jgi:hypothetical protein
MPETAPTTPRVIQRVITRFVVREQRRAGGLARRPMPRSRLLPGEVAHSKPYAVANDSDRSVSART